MSAEPLVRTHALTKQYRGGTRAVDDVALEVHRGDVYGFLGANGSGKTTTIRMLLGLVQPTSGEVHLLGEPIPRGVDRVLTRVGALVEGPGGYAHLSGRANLQVLDAAGRGSLGRAARRRRTEEVLEQVGLDPGDRRPVRTYSLGMRQRLGLAAALYQRPELLVLDEPTNGLDPQGITEIRELLLALNREGTTVLLSSHLLSEVEQMSTRVGVLADGRLVLQDELTALNAPTGRVRLRTPDPDRAAGLLGRRLEQRDADVLLVRSPDAAALNTELVGAGVRVAELGPERRSLEQVVLAATRAAGEAS